MSQDRPARKVVAATTAIALAVFALGMWAGRIGLAPPTVAPSIDETLVFSTVDGSIGRTEPFVATAAWDVSRVIVSLASGPLTAVPDAGEIFELNDGDSVLSIREVPMTAVLGEVPMYRDLGRGMSGEDVRQLQAFLQRQGYLEAGPDGDFGAATESAVEQWQDELGIDVSGVVAIGAVVFVAELPTQVSISSGISIGRLLVPEHPILDVVGASPQFEISTSVQQADDLLAGMSVSIAHATGTWEATLGQSRHDSESGAVHFDLVPRSGGDPVCQDLCGLIPLGEVARFASDVEVVPTVAGVAVPLAALTADSVGQSSLVVAEGRNRIEVEILGSDRGVAIVEGIDVGTEVLLFGGSEPE